MTRFIVQDDRSAGSTPAAARLGLVLLTAALVAMAIAGCCCEGEVPNNVRHKANPMPLRSRFIPPDQPICS